jgi:hypothetical protein
LEPTGWPALSRRSMLEMRMKGSSMPPAAFGRKMA